MSISSKRSTVRSVELSQAVAAEEMLAVEELSVMQEADVLDMEAREQASKQSAEDEALQVAQVNMPTEYLENPAAAAEVMSDVGEAGLVGEESISRWEAQEVAFAGAGGGAGAGFWGGMGGFGAAAGGIAAGGLAHQNSMDSSGSSGGRIDVVFDFTTGQPTSGMSSSVDGARVFDAAETYSIYLYIDQSTSQNFNSGYVWSGWENLGADDTVIFVSAAGGPLINGTTTAVTNSGGYSGTSSNYIYAVFTGTPVSYSDPLQAAYFSYYSTGSVYAGYHFDTGGGSYTRTGDTGLGTYNTTSGTSGQVVDLQVSYLTQPVAGLLSAVTWSTLGLP